MSYCGVVEVRNPEDALGATCARPAKGACSDCGTAVCEEHLERCDLCRKTFCQNCLSFHHAQAEHAKAATPERASREKRKSA